MRTERGRGSQPRVPIAAGYDGIVCDLDGVVYRGARAVDGAPATLDHLRHQGLRVVFATNNAARPPDQVASQLVALGARCTADDVVTSAQAGAAHLAATLPARTGVLALGGPGVTGALLAVGLSPVSPDRACDGDVEAVLQGLGRQLTVTDFEVAARQLSRGVLWVATNHDATFPLEWGLAPGNGAYVALLEATSGRHPIVVGKPEPPLYELATHRLGTQPSRTLAVGDRLDTDIDGAHAAGLDCAWVLTGVDPPSALLRRPGLRAPTYVIGALRELLEPDAAAVPQQRGAESVWTCRSATARMVWDRNDAGAGPSLSVDVGTGAGSVPMDGVRAGLAALLATRDGSDVPLAELERLAHGLDALLAP